MNTCNEFPALNVELMENGLINLIDPTDTGDGNIWSVQVHPQQLRWITDQVFPVTPAAAVHHPSPGAGMLEVGAERLANLQWNVSRMLPTVDLIVGRVKMLRESLISLQDDERENLNIEVAQAGALQDIAETYFEDLEALVARQAAQSPPVSRHVTPRHDLASRPPRSLDVPQAGPGAPAANEIQALEHKAMATFTQFVKSNAPLLRVVAHFGDGECGALLHVLQKELLGWEAQSVAFEAGNGAASGRKGSANHAAQPGQLELDAGE
ncbi:MAG: hypothetical protein EOO27_00930 [Comamonadaceae bacterium]|nr:MAG: hypothetical protein EOO27_00930 [Comamonadaceae bacterium]